MHAVRHRRSATHRAGLTTPVVALALLLAMAGLALILDRIWLETAQLELNTAAEATALAAARQLAQDDRLIPNTPEQQRLDAAQTAAELTAAMNLVAGQTPSFNPARNDILFGSYSQPQGDSPILLQTDVTDPQTVRITLHRSRSRSNPVALFIGQLTGVPFGDVNRQADATVNNHVEGLRPVVGATVPALPLAIWKVDPTGSRSDTWDLQIEQRQGSDNFCLDADTQLPIDGSDGIPEITLRSLASGQPPASCNLQVVDLGSGFDDSILEGQFRSGWSDDDLASVGGMIDPAAALVLSSSPELMDRDRDALEAILGEPRICLLFSSAVPSGNENLVQITCAGLVAVARNGGPGSIRRFLQRDGAADGDRHAVRRDHRGRRTTPERAAEQVHLQPATDELTPYQPDAQAMIHQPDAQARAMNQATSILHRPRLRVGLVLGNTT